MFGSQFDKAEKLLGETPDPLLVYGVEVSIQMYIAELSEPLRGSIWCRIFSSYYLRIYLYAHGAEDSAYFFTIYKEAELKDFLKWTLPLPESPEDLWQKCDLYFYHGKQIKKITEMLLYLI